MNRQEFIGLVVISSCLAVGPLVEKDTLILPNIARRWHSEHGIGPKLQGPLYYSEVKSNLETTNAEYLRIYPTSSSLVWYVDLDIRGKEGLENQTKEQRIITIQRYKD